jgi:hypothetical protein
MAESPEEKQALENLDEATREVAWEEYDKDSGRKFAARLVGWGRLGRWNLPGLARFTRKKGDPVPEPVNEPDPGDEHGLRDALHGDEEKD